MKSETNPAVRPEQEGTGTAATKGTPHHAAHGSESPYSQDELNGHMHTLMEAEKVKGDSHLMGHLKPHMDAHMGLMQSVHGALDTGGVSGSTKGSAKSTKGIHEKVKERLSQLQHED